MNRKIRVAAMVTGLVVAGRRLVGLGPERRERPGAVGLCRG